MVRLKVLFLVRSEEHFQRFQFQYGSVESDKAVTDKDLRNQHFNSSMVRLKGKFGLI